MTPLLARTEAFMTPAAHAFPMPQILVVDDDAELRNGIADYLSQHGYGVLQAGDALAMEQALAGAPIDLIVLDLMLPGEDGLSICRRISDAGGPAIIMLSAMGEEIDRILGLELGADDYVTKPFSPQELVSRVRAVLRRVQRTDADKGERSLVYGDLCIDPQRRLVEVKGREVALTAREFDLLWVLARHPRQVFNRDQLLDQVWGLTEYIDGSTITVHGRRLREKIETDASDPRYIQTVWGVGYKFEP